jgi:hypothetical protein
VAFYEATLSDHYGFPRKNIVKTPTKIVVILEPAVCTDPGNKSRTPSVFKNYLVRDSSYDPMVATSFKTASRRLKALLLAGFLVPFLTIVQTLKCESKPFIGCPPIMLWAWEYPADLTFIDPEKTGVAYLAATIHLDSDRVIAKCRRQPLNVPPGTYMMAVLRIEPDRKSPPQLSESQLSSLTSSITKIIALHPVRALQIDFDARVSERDFYHKLLERIRAALPTGMPLSITSLASWCLKDTWIKDMPCDEVVPMFFSMGADRRRVLFDLASGLATMPMEESIGISVAEPDVLARLGDRLPRRIYIFCPHGWNSSNAHKWIKTFEMKGQQWKKLASG